MKVKVSQTLDMEEVPDLVAQITGQCQRALLTSADMLRINMHDVPSSIEKAEKVIRDITLTAEKLQDVINIASGWHQAMYADIDTEETSDEEAE